MAPFGNACLSRTTHAVVISQIAVRRSLTENEPSRVDRPVLGINCPITSGLAEVLFGLLGSDEKLTFPAVCILGHG